MAVLCNFQACRESNLNLKTSDITVTVHNYINLLNEKVVFNPKLNNYNYK